MLEFYQAYADYETMMEVTQDLIVHAVRSLHGGTLVPHEGRTIDFAPPWNRLRYKEAAAEALGVAALPEGEADLRALAARAGLKLDPALGWGRILDEVISEKVQPLLERPTFLLDYPKDVSPLAKARRGDATVVERFELIAA